MSTMNNQTNQIGQISSDIDLKRSNAKSGFWGVTTQPSYKGKWKAMIPCSGKMIPKSAGGGMFDYPIEAARVLKRYCLLNNIEYII